VVGAFGSVVDAVTATLGVQTEGVEPQICELVDDRVLAALEDLDPLGLPEGVGALLLLQFGERSTAATAEAILSGNRAWWTARADSPAESELLFAVRRRAYDAVCRRGRITTEDVCVPIGVMGEVMVSIQEVGRRLGVEIATVAHAGDGNLHPMLIDDGTIESGTTARAFEEIMDIALRAGGTVSGEHGVGLLKRAAAIRDLGDLVVNLSSKIKSVFDPRGIMNPGKGPLFAAGDLAL
jgi:glycolate oxidase